MDRSWEFNIDFVRSKLKRFNSPLRAVLEGKDFVKSAVMLLIIPRKNLPFELVMIKRTVREGDKHSGEMGFPGGKYDPSIDESLKYTALRETEEELSIPRDDITVLGSFSDHLTPKKFVITPFVGYIKENQPMKKQEGEIEEILTIPISYFANKNNYKERTYLLNNSTIAVGKYKYYSPEGKKYVIFGASCHIIVNFLQLVYDIQLMEPGTRRLTCQDFALRDKKLSK